MATRKRVRKSQRNQGGQLLERLGIPYKDIAATLAVSPASVSQYIKGTVKPDQAKRELLFQLHSIPVNSWDEAVVKAKASSENDESQALAKVPETALGQANHIEGLVRELLSKVDQEDPPAKKLAIIGKATEILARVGKMTGEDAVSQAKIVKSPDWRKIVNVLTEAVKPFGSEVSEAIAKALRQLDEAS